MMITTALLKQELDQLLGSGIDNGEEVAYFCPLCVAAGKTPDTKGKLYVNFKKRQRPDASPGVFFCFRCESAGSIEKLFKFMGVPLVDQTPTAKAFQDALKLFHSEEGEDVEYQPVVEVDHTLELARLGCHRTKYDEPEYKYLLDRGLTHDDMKHYKILTGAGRYYARVIVPTFHNGKVPFFVARAIKPLYFKTPDGKVDAPKYLNPKGEARRNCIFNLDKADGEKIIVTEGVFSAISAGREAVATFGKLVTQNQIDLIRERAKGREIVVCLDGDAHVEGVNLAARLDGAGATVSVVLLPFGTDPSDLQGDFTKFLDGRWRYHISTLLEKQLSGEFYASQRPTTFKRQKSTFVSLAERFLNG